MTITDLVNRLVVHLTAALAENRQEAPSGAPCPPLLVAGWLPPKRGGAVDDPPCLVVRPISGTDGDDGGHVVVRLMLCTFSERTEGWQDLTNVVQRVRNSLLGVRTLGPFHLELPLTWTIYDEQPRPQWEAAITTTWTQMAVQWTGETE